MQGESDTNREQRTNDRGALLLQMYTKEGFRRLNGPAGLVLVVGSVPQPCQWEAGLAVGQLTGPSCQHPTAAAGVAATDQRPRRWNTSIGK